MGIIKAVTSALGGTLADQWLEVWAADGMGDTVVMTSGVPVRRSDKRNQNKKGSADVLTDGSVIQVGVGQCMLLTDGGKVVDYSAEPGYYEVKTGRAPSLFNGQLGEALEDTFRRVKFGGVTPYSQKAVFINLQEIKNIAFGTPNPISYFDNFYNAELFLRAHGYFSLRVIEPLKFYTEAIPHNMEKVDIGSIHKLYLAEFLTALQTVVGKMSADGARISHIPSKSGEVAQYLSTALDEEWTRKRGIIIESVGIASISYDEDSRKLIDMRNEGAMLSDASIREGYVQGSVARGVEAAGSNSGGAMAGFMGVNMGAQTGGIGAMSAGNQAQIARQQTDQPLSADAWTCPAGHRATGNFCASCGAGRPDVSFCPACGARSEGGSFCASCGHKLRA